MIPPLPNLADYQISVDNGFLPADSPLDRLPDPYYGPWEDVATNLRNLLVSKEIRKVVDELPLLSTSRLQTEAEWRRAYVVLGFMTNSYIWGLEKAKDVCARRFTSPDRLQVLMCGNRGSRNAFQFHS
jgi:indoleamine 2,3-dioxygenase